MAIQYRIGEWLIRPARSCIERDGKAVRLKPKPMAVLQCLAKAGNEVVSRDALFEAIWPGQIVSDAVLTQCIVELRRAFGDSAQDPRVIQTVPKVGFCLVPRVEVLDSESLPMRAEYPTPWTRLRSYSGILIVSAALLAAAAVMAWSYLHKDTFPVAVKPIDYSSPSIAVLPFDNLSADPDDLFFVDGVHQDLLTRISKIGTIKTISRTSVMRYRDTTLSIPDIAQELDVATVLEGAVQRVGDQVRINVELIDAVSDDHLWSQTYDRKLTAASIFTIQSEIAGAITEALRTTFTPEARQRSQSLPTDSLKALETFFLGRQLMAKRTVADLKAAVEHFENAVTLDSEFALAYVELANALRLHGAYAYIPQDKWNERDDEIKTAVNTALRLDPYLAEAHAALAWVRMSDGDEESVEDAFKRSIELNPNYAPAYQWYGEWLGGLNERPGRVEDALELTRTAVSLDPISAIINNDHAEVLQTAGQLQEALEYYRKAIDIEPDFASGYQRIAGLKITEFGNIDEGLQALSQSYDIDPVWNTANWMSVLFLDLGDTQQAAAWRDRALELAPEGVVPDSVWLLHYYRGEYSLALEYMLDELKRNHRNAWVLWYLKLIYLRQDRPDAIRALYEEGFPELMDTNDPDVNWWNAFPAVDFANVLLSTGEHELAHRLLDLSEAARSVDHWKSPYELVAEAKIHALRGDLDRGLAVFRKAVENGYRNWAWVELRHGTALAPLRGMPMFEAIKAKVENDLERQLTTVRARQANE